MSIYKRLNLNEREELSRYLAMNFSYRQIARTLERSPSTICREVNRRSFQRSSYRAIPAHRQALRIAQIHRKQRKLSSNKKLRQTVIKYLQRRWSPEQIAKMLRILYPDDVTMQISHETIYAYVYVHPRKHLKRQLLFYLRRKHINRRHRSKTRQKSYPIQDYVSIEDRPKEVTDRKIPGHWEGDFKKVTHTDSATVAALLGRLLDIEKEKKRIALFNIPEKFRRLIEVLKVEHNFLIYDNESIALSELQ